MKSRMLAIFAFRGRELDGGESRSGCGMRLRRGAGRWEWTELGLTVVELVLIVALIATIASILVPFFARTIDKTRIDKAVLDITMIETDLRIHFRDSGDYPDSLDDLPGQRPLDPWGNPYQYLRLTDLKGKGKARKDRFLVPLNTDFDLYSMGPDGESQSPLTATASRDDIVRANNGGFIGPASEF